MDLSGIYFNMTSFNYTQFHVKSGHLLAIFLQGVSWQIINGKKQSTLVFSIGNMPHGNMVSKRINSTVTCPVAKKRVLGQTMGR